MTQQEYEKDKGMAGIFSMFALLSILLGWYMFSNGVPCKKRLAELQLEQMEKIRERDKTKPDRHIIFVRTEEGESYFCLCKRCAGFWEGVLIFTILALANGYYFHFPPPSFFTAPLFTLGVALTFVPAIHGTARRHYKKDFASVTASNAVLYLSGFLVALGGFLTYWTGQTLWGGIFSFFIG